jgi:predicted enzyme related to lactoylglutathione lyase
MGINFEAGINIAIKIPKSKYDKTVAFYKNILKLQVEEKPIDNPTVSRTHEVKFGNNIIWLDCVDNYTHSETWLQLTVPNVEEATSYLKLNGVETCDEIEELPENMHWIQDPAGTVFNVQTQVKNLLTFVGRSQRLQLL